MASVQERLNRMKQDGLAAAGSRPGQGTPTLQQRLERMRQDGAAGGKAKPSAQPAASAGSPGLAAPARGMPEWLSTPSFGPLPGTRSSRAVREEMDGMDKAMGALRERRDGLNAQAQALDSHTQAMKRRAGAYADAVTGRGAAAQSAQLRRQAQELEKELARLEQGKAGLQAEWGRADAREFEQLRRTPEFRAAVDKAMDGVSGLPEVTSPYSKYADVSRAMRYFQAKARGDEQWAQAARQNADMALDKMDEGQRDRLAYYVGTGDYDGALDYLNRIMPGLNQAAAEEVGQGMAQWAQQHPVLGAATNVVSWPMNIPAYFDNARQGMENLITGEERQSPRLNAYVGPKIGSGAAQGTQEAVRSAAAQATGSERMGDAAAFLTGTALSIGQNATQIALLGPGSLPAMAMSAAGSSTAEALDRGAAPGEALAVGTAAGAIETITEKLPLDNLFRLAKEGGGQGLKETVKSVLKQMGTEATEEAVSEIANNVADTAVMGDRSEFQGYVRELQAAGLPLKEAQRQAFTQFYFLNTLASAAGGAISGGVMSGGAMALNRLGSRGAQSTAAESALEEAAQGAATDSDTVAEGQAAQGKEAGEAGRENLLKGLADTAQTLRETYARGEITGEGFDQAMDRLQEQAELMGLEMSQALKLLDGGTDYRTEGAADHGEGTREAGEQLFDRDGGRLPGAGAGGQAASVGEGGPQGPADAGGAAAQETAPGEHLRIEAVSSRELGLVNGTDARTVRVLPEEAWDGALRQTARRVRRETGLPVRFTLGPMETVRQDGVVFRVRGVYNREGAGIIVQADNRTATAAQIADHEIFHSYAQSDPGLVLAAAEAVVERYGQEELDSIVDAYIQNLRGIVNVSELDTLDEPAFSRVLEKVKNEVLADAFAGINAFGVQASNYQEAVYDTLESRGTATPRGRENAQAMDSRTGPPEAHSIEYDRDNRPFVTVEEDILAGVPRENWVKTVKDSLRRKFPNGVTVGNREIKIDRQSIGEMTFSRYTQRLMKTNPELFADKLRALPNADELLQASRGWVNEGLNHLRKDNIQEFARGIVQLRIGENDYTANVVVASKKNGDMLLYDLLNLKPAEIKEKAGHSKVIIVNPQSETDSQAMSSKDSITQGGDAVKAWDGTLPRGTDTGFTLPGGEAGGGERYSAQPDQDGVMLPGNGVPDGRTLPTLAEKKAMRAKARSGDVSDSDTIGQKQSVQNSREQSGRVSSSIENLPITAQEKLQKAERRMASRLAKALGMPKGADVNFLRNITQKISAEYMEIGGLSQETKDALFEQAYKLGAEVGRAYLDTYKNVQNFLRLTPITVDEKTRWTIADYDDWRSSVSDVRTLLRSGAVQFVSNDGADVNSAYTELQHLAPNLFPEDITHTEDQLRFILETAKNLRLAEQRAEEYYGSYADEFKRQTWRDFDRAIADGIGEFKETRQYAEGRAARARARDEGIVASQTGKTKSPPNIQHAMEANKTDMARVSRARTSEEAAQQRSAWEESLPAKALEYLQRAERRLIRKVGELLDVPRPARQEFLQDIVRNLSTEYLETGQVSQETRDELFERAYEQSMVVDREYYDDYKHVRDYLRSTPIEVSEWLKGDIDDYGAWRKSAFGTLRLVKKNGIGPDTAYIDLQHMAPGLFPDSITHPADQLRHILATAKDIRASEQSLDEYYGPDADAFKRMTWRDFDDAVAEALSDLRHVKRYADERAGEELTRQQQAEKEEFAPKTAQEATEAYKKLKAAQRACGRANAKNLLTKDDIAQVGRLLLGAVSLDQLDPKRYNVKGIREVYEAKREYEEMAGQIRAWNKRRKAQLRAEADGFLETANQWKDKKAGILYSRETMERNIRDIVPDRDLAERINKRYFQPVHQAAAAANKMKNEYRDRVRALGLSRKAAKGDTVSESYAVQLLGEAEDNIRRLEDGQGRNRFQEGEKNPILELNGKTIQEWQAAIGELWENSPSLDQKKIRGAVEEFRAIYDELFQQMNETRVRNGYEPVSYRQGYFPHFQADSEGLMAQFGKALGIDTAVTNLPTTINGLTHTFKPGIQYFGNALERKGFDTAYDAVQGFDRYIEGVADVIHQTDNIQALRALAAQARYRTGDEGLRQQIKRIQESEELTDQEKQTLVDDIYKNGRFALSNFVVELDEYTNLLANKKSRADRNMEQALGRRMHNIVKGLESRVAANMVAVNPASWLTNFVPLTQGWGAVKGRYMLEGMWDTLKAVKEDDGMVGMSSFLTNRRGSDPIVRTWQQGASAKLSQPMEWIDCFTADSLVRARFKQNQAAGLSEAASIEEADAWAAGVMADRSKGSTPTLFNRSNPLTKMFTQFQLEVNNQLSYLFKDIPREGKDKGLAALAAMLFKLFLGAYLYNETYEALVGRRCALDPIGILNDSVGDFTGYQIPNLWGMVGDAAQGKEISFKTEKKKPYEAAAALGVSLAEELPFVGGPLGGGRLPVSSAWPDVKNLGKAVLNDQWDGKKRAATALKAMSGPAAYLALPFGGGQVKKIYQGLKTVLEGGSYTVDNEGRDILQYPVFNETFEDGLLTLPTALTFGKSSLPTAREWAERGFKSMSAKETTCYQGMVGLDVPQRDAYALLRAIGDVEAPAGEDVAATEKAAYQKRKLLREAGISEEGKGVVYYTLLASDREREVMDALENKGEGARVLMALKDAGAELKGQELSAGKKKAIAGSALGEEEKDAIFRYVLGKDSKGAAWSEKLAGAGLDGRSAAAVANALNALTPEQGKKTVSDAQKWRAVLDTARGAENQKAALLTVMEDSARTRFEIAAEYGITPEAWVRLKEAVPQFDADGNGSYSGKEVRRAIDALGGDGSLLAPWDKAPVRLSREEKAVLWQLFTGNKSGGGNPYSTRVGKKVAGELEEAREKRKEKEG